MSSIDDNQGRSFDPAALPFFRQDATEAPEAASRGSFAVPAAARAHLARKPHASGEIPVDEVNRRVAAFEDEVRDIGRHSIGDEDFWIAVADLRRKAVDRQVQSLDGRHGLADAAREEMGRQHIIDVVNEHVSEQMRSDGQRNVWDDNYRRQITKATFDQMFRLGRYQELIDDDQVENIHIHGHDLVFAEYSDGRMVQKPPVASSDEQLMEDLQFFANRNGEEARSFSSAHPDLDMDLLGYVRLAAVAKPIAERPSAVLRIHRYINITLEQLVKFGTLTSDQAHFLSIGVKAKKTFVICGEGGDGKTTLMRAMAGEIGPMEQIVTIEMERELHLKKLHGRVVPPFALQYRPGTGELDAYGRSPGEYTLEQCMRKGLRLNSRRIMVGEVRGPEIVSMIHAMQTGAGTMSTTHADSPDDCIDRLAGLGIERYGKSYMMEQLGRHIDFVVQMAKVVDHTGKATRRVSHISEVLSAEGDRGVSTQDIFRVEPGEQHARFMRVPARERLRQDLIRAGLDETRFQGGHL
jgi:Flp pilus assembly CpaF family ATPase